MSNGTVEIARVRRGVTQYAGHARWDGGIVDCDALGDDVLAALDMAIVDAIENAGDHGAEVPLCADAH